jgi:hypothetical protein
MIRSTVLVFIRLRAVLCEVCPDHPVAMCETCGHAYKPEQLGTDIGTRCHLCHRCGADLRASLKAHARTCPNLTPAKPPARMVPGLPSRSFPQPRHLSA